MKDEVNILVRKGIRFAFHLFFVFPIKRNRIMFESYKGKSYSCNPKYVSEYLYNNHKNEFELVWVFREPEKHRDIKGITSVKYNSLKYFYYRFTSKIIICNMTDEVYLPKRKQQVVINTWHAGGAYKRVGLSYSATFSKATQWQDEIVRKETSYYVSSSALFTKYNIQEAYHYDGEVLNIGMPRNDCLFDRSTIELLSDKVRDSFKAQEKVIVLYAPTFRGDFSHAESLKVSLPFETVIREMENKYGKEAVIFNRSHYTSKDVYTGDNKKVIDVTSHEDMQELLAAADLLITDYSSSIWDFAILGKPCILYIPDFDEYMGDRGTYTPVEKWPGIIAKNESELENVIRDVSEEKCRQMADQHLKLFGSYENGNASALLSKKIREVIS